MKHLIYSVKPSSYRNSYQSDKSPNGENLKHYIYNGKHSGKMSFNRKNELTRERNCKRSASNRFYRNLELFLLNASFH